MARDEPIGVIGGSGFYQLLDGPVPRPVSTPYGEPSEVPAAGTLAGRDVIFLPRHGADHRFAPHLVPYRANLWALRTLGVRQVISLSAVGSLDPSLGIGTLAVPDQIFDRTWGRAQTYFDAADGVGHVSFADPYCPRGRAAALASDDASPGGDETSGSGRTSGGDGVPASGPASGGDGSPVGGAIDGGTLVVINGPRFSSRAESRHYASLGGTLIGMTAMPEATLARELGLCYTTLALVTDLDAGVVEGEGVTHAAVLEQFAENLPKLRDLLLRTLAALPEAQGDCSCGDTGHLPPGFTLP